MLPSVTYLNAPQKTTHSPEGNESKTFRITGIIPNNPGNFHNTRIREIRNPLTNIGLAAEFLKLQTGDETQEKALDIIIQNAARINKMVTGLLRPENNNKNKVVKQNVQFLLEEVLTKHQKGINQKGITISKSYTTQEFTKEFDCSGLKLVLSDIIIHAINTMIAGKGWLKIEIKILRGACFIIIEDNSADISRDDLRNLFKPYFINKPEIPDVDLSNMFPILYTEHIGVDVRSVAKKGTRFILALQSAAL